MPRLSEDEKIKVNRLIAEDVSLAKISALTRRAKSTLYPYYKKLKGKKFREPEFETNYSELEGEIVGIFTGDGSQHYHHANWQYSVNVHLGKLEYAQYVRTLFEKYFNKSFRLGKQSPTVWRLRTESKKIFNHFKNYLDYEPKIKHCTVKLKNVDFPKEFKIGFLRGLVDTDGTVCKCKDKRIRIAFTTTSKKLAKQTKSLLEEFGFKAFTCIKNRKMHNLKDCYDTYLFNASVRPFLALVNPFKGRKFPGPYFNG